MQALKTRDILIGACHALRVNLDRTMKRHLARHPDRYQKRYTDLIKVLIEFETNPGRLDSSFNPGIAEKIYMAVPAEMLKGVELEHFKLQPKKHGLNTPLPFGLYELALVMEDAYRKQAFNNSMVFDPVFGEISENGQIDPICDELTAFFGMIKNPLKNIDTDNALKYVAKNTLTKNKILEIKSLEKPKDDKDIDAHEVKSIQRALNRNPDILELFSRKCCKYCFRLIEERNDSEKNMTGQTCPLHDSQKNHNGYTKARKTLKRITKENSEIAEDDAAAVERRQNPMGIRMFMLLGLIHQKWDLINPEFKIIQECLSAPEETGVPRSNIEELKNFIWLNFPLITEPETFINRIEELEKNKIISVKRLFNIMIDFIKTDRLPFHPELVAFQMESFFRESCWAQKHNPNYYNLGLSKGRPQKHNHDTIYSEYMALISKAHNNRQEVVSNLANKYECTTKTIQNIIKKNTL